MNLFNCFPYDSLPSACFSGQAVSFIKRNQRLKCLYPGVPTLHRLAWWADNFEAGFACVVRYCVIAISQCMNRIVDLGKHVSFRTGSKSFILPLFSICVASCDLLEHRHCMLLSCSSSRQLSTFRHTWQTLLVQVPAPLCFCGQAWPQLRIWYQCLECL